MATNGITEVKANGSSSPAVAASAVAAAVTVQAEPTYAELKARIAQVEAQLAAKSQPGQLTIRINDGVMKNGEQGKGTIGVYGLGRFPLSQYAEQWERLLTPANVETILKLCKDPRASRKVR